MANALDLLNKFQRLIKTYGNKQIYIEVDNVISAEEIETITAEIDDIDYDDYDDCFTIYSKNK